MSKPLSSVGSKIRGWLKKHLYYDALFMLRSASHAGMQQLREMLAPLAAAFRAESAPRKIRPYVPSGEVLEDRQLLTTVQFSAGAYALIESGGAATISVTLDAPSAMTITVDYATADGTAVQAIDYTSVQGTQTYQTLVFAPNDTVKSFTVTLLDDSLDEYDETVSLVLANPTGATLGSPASSTLTILDDDSPPTVALDASSYSVSETAGAKTITVELSAESGKTVTVDFATSDGTATAGTDYGSASGVLTFAPGQTSKTFSVPITDDEQSEGDETVALTLSSPSNASLGAYDYADLTITNTTPTDYLPDSGSAGVDTGKGASVSFGTGNFNINLLTGNFHLDVPVSQSSRKGESDVIYYYAGLAYNSNTATPNPMVSVRVPTSAADPSPTQVRGRLTWGSTVQDWVTLTGSYVAGKELFFSLQSASTVATTGRYNYAIDVELSFATRGAIVRSFTGSTIVVVNGSAPFGYGWSLPDLNYLVTDGAGGDMILVQGDGGYREFSYDSGSNTYSTPEGNGDNGIFTKTSGGSVTTYTYTDSSQIEWIYKSNGQLVNVVDPSGQRVTYAYDGDRLSTVIQPTNFAVTFTYSGTNLSSITRGYFAGSTFMPYATTTVTYSSGDLTGITDSEGNSRTFGYTAHKLTSDSHGPQIGYSNGAAAQAAQGSGLATFTVSALLPRALNNALADTGIAATITNPGASAPTSITLDSYGRSTGQISPLGARSTIVRDSTGMPSVNIDANANRTTSTYDGVTQRPATITDAMGGVTTYLYSTTFRTPTTIIDPAGRVTTYVLDSAGNVLNVVDSSSNRVSYTWSAGLVQSITDTNNRTTTFLYDSYRQLQVAIDPSGQRTTYSFNPATGSTSIDTVNAGPTSAIDDALGRRTVDIDANGNRTSYTYTAAGQREATIEPNGNRTTTVYDTANRPIASIDSLGNRSTTVYDAAGRVSSTIDIYSRATTFLYDEDGRRTGTINSLGNRTTTVYDPAGHVLRTIDQYGKTTTFLYDDAGRQTGQIDPFGNRTTTIYDAAGNVVTAVDQFGHVTTNTYANGNLTSTIDWLNLRTTYTYTAAGKLETVKDQYGFVTTNLYDASNRLAGTINAFGNRTTITYTATSQIATQSDEFGNVTTFHYDASDRLEATEDRYGRRATTVYDAAGRVEATVDVFGNRSTTVYDGDGRTVATIDYLGNRTTTVYDIKGRVEATIDPLGNRVTTVYDAAGRVEATIDMLGQRTTSVYDGFSRLIATVDPYGNRTSTAYDAFGQVEATIDPFGNRSTFVYDSNGRQIATIDPYGNRATTVYDSYGRVAETIDIHGKYTTTVYDAFGRVQATVDKFGNRSTTVYDTRGRIEATVDMLGNRVTTVFDSDGRQVATIDIYGNRSTTVYDAFNRVSAQIDGLGRRTTFLYDSRGRQEAIIDPLGQRVTTVFETRGRVSAQIDALGNATTFQYDASGRQEATIDAFGHRASVYYDSFGRTESTTDLLGNRTTTVWDSRGRQEATIDAIGRRSTVVYDSLNRVSTQIDGAGDRTTTLYDSNGRVEAKINRLGQRVTTIYDAHGEVQTTINEAGLRTTNVYDARGRIEATIDTLGRRNTTVFDSRGRIEAMIDSDNNRTTTAYDTRGRIEATIDKNNGRTTTAYDAFGRIDATIQPDATRVTNVYDSFSRVHATIDALGGRSTIVFDAFGRQIATIDQLGNRTTTVFDAIGRQQNLIDASGNKTTFVYDALNRLAQDIDPLGHAVTYAYDTENRVSSRTDRNGRRIDYSYDVLNRKSGETWYNSDGTTVSNRVTWTYDGVGRIATASDFDGAYTFTYDSRDQVANVADPLGNLLTFTYDARGNRTAVQDSQGGVTTSTFDNDNRLTRRDFSNGTTPMRIDYSYDDKGQVKSITRYGNLAGTLTVATTDYSYNVDQQITNLLHKNGSSVTISSLTFTYDSKHRLTSLNTDGSIATYVYDSTDQVTADGNTTVTYDATGNRNNGSYSTATGNRLSTDGVWNYTYDNEGNLTKKSKGAFQETWLYGYDQVNHLISADKWSEDPASMGTPVLQLEADYKYDVFGNRIEKRVDNDGAGAGSANTTKFAYDQWNPAKSNPLGTENADIWGDFSGGSLTTRYVHGDHIDDLLARIDGVNPRWYLKDHLGSIRKVIDNTAAVKDSIAYDAFGNILSETDANERGRYAWTSREIDIETALQYNRARYYDATTGRWISQDPLGFDAGDSNLYRYVTNQVANAIDANGMGPIFVTPGIGSDQTYKVGPNWGIVGGGPDVVDKKANPPKQPQMPKLDIAKELAEIAKADQTKRPVNLINEMIEDKLAFRTPGGRVYTQVITPEGVQQVIYEPYYVRHEAPFVAPSRVVDTTRIGIKHEVNRSTLGTNIAPDYYKLVYRTDKTLDRVKYDGLLSQLGLGRGPTLTFKPIEQIREDKLADAARLIERQWTLLEAFNIVSIGHEFTASLLPLRNTVLALTEGKYGEAAISAVGDAALFLGVWGRVAHAAAGAAKTASVAAQQYQLASRLVRASIAGEAIVGSIRFAQGVFEVTSPSGDNLQAASYFGEAALRLIGVTRSTIRWLKANCFPPDTLVSTETGLRPIKEIEAGQRVWAYNFQKGEWQLSEVECRHDNDWEGNLHKITTEHGSVEVTPNHPFWVVQGEGLESRVLCPEVGREEDRGGCLEGRWVDAFDVRAGDVVFLRGRGQAIVRSVSARVMRAATCNLTVRDLRTFAVGEMQVLVHNTSGMRARGLAQLAELGLADVELANESFNSGRRQLLAAGFEEVARTAGQSTGRTVFRNPRTGAIVIHDSGNALVGNQRAHWHIRDAGGQGFDRGGRAVGPGEDAGHIPAAN